jgi:hypothetical protein
MIDAQSHGIRLRDELYCRIDIAQGPGGIRSSAGYQVRLAAFALELGGDLGQFAVHIRIGCAMFDAGTMQMVQKDIAALRVVMVGFAGPILEQDVAIDAHLRRACSGLSRVIGLRRTLSQDNVRVLLPRFGEQVLELPRLVAAGRHAGAIVAFDPDLRPIERPAQIRQVFQGCRQVGETNSRETCKVHLLLTFKNGIGAPA